MFPFVLLVVYCVILLALSLFGGWLPTLWKWSHIRIQLLMSSIAGFMLGIALVQLLPHSYEILKDGRSVGLTMLGGLLAMFFLIRIFDFHHHHFPDKAKSDEGHDHQEESKSAVVVPSKATREVTLGGEAQEVVLTCAHDHDHSHDHSKGRRSDQPSLAWVGLLLGLGLHSIMDGVALAASLKADMGIMNAPAFTAGLGIFLAIAFHKPLDSMSIASVMAVSNWGRTEQFWVNIVFALSCPLAAVFVYFGLDWLPADSGLALGFALAFSAGTFLCISLGDLLPELHFHSHDRLKLSISLLAGIALAVILEFLATHNH